MGLRNRRVCPDRKSDAAALRAQKRCPSVHYASGKQRMEKDPLSSAARLTDADRGRGVCGGGQGKCNLSNYLQITMYVIHCLHSKKVDRVL